MTDDLQPTFELARDGRTEELAALIDSGLPPDLTDDRGDTLLILAAYHARPATVGMLLERGADTSKVNDRGQTALGAAVFRNSAEMVQALLGAGADPALGSPTAHAVARFFDLPAMTALLPDDQTRRDASSGVGRNRDAWNAKSEWYQSKHGPQLDSQPLAWGAWAIPEAEVGALGDVSGKVVLELGCGGGQWSAFLADAGARPIGLDVSERQLAAAVVRMRRPYPLVHADGGCLPLAPETVDLVISDHGAMSWADPMRTVPEASRVLRPGGRLVFNTSTPWIYVCEGRDGLSEQLTRSYYGLHEAEEGDGSSTFVLGYGDWIRLFRRCGLGVEDLIELRPPDGATTAYDDYVPFDWARRWPAEAIWVTSRTSMP